MKELKEHWEDIEGYEGLYQVSDWGNVRSLNYKQTGKTKLLKPVKDDKGYLHVRLYKDGKWEQKRIHRLVAEAFITNPKPNEYKQVNHKSECPMLNFACVLEWCTTKYNTNYGTCIQRMADSRSKPVDQFDKDGIFIRHWKSAKEAGKQLKIHQNHIGDCARLKRKTAGGYIWKFTKS